MLKTLTQFIRLQLIGAVLMATVACAMPSLDITPITDPTVEASAWSNGTVETKGWVMSYFGNNGSTGSVADDSLHIGYSVDGLHWKDLNFQRPVYSTNIGFGHLRDPHLFRANDGKVIMLASDWTEAARYTGSDYWTKGASPYILVAESTDLMNFTNGHRLKLANKIGANEKPHAWAPQAIYDPVKKMYAIYWSGNDETGTNRIYISYTTDFVTVVNLDEPKVLFDPGYSVTDATSIFHSGKHYLFFKDETFNAATGRGKDVQGAASADSTFGSFTPLKVKNQNYYLTRPASQLQVEGSGGPLVIKDPLASKWYLFADLVNKPGFRGAWSNTNLDDPKAWTRLETTEFEMPSNVRHGNAIRVTEDELNMLVAKMGIPAGTTKLKTTYTESSGTKIFYAAQEANIGMIREYAKEDRGLNWFVRPALDTPSDPTLVSFESAATPGQYLWVDSVDGYKAKISLNPNATAATFKLVAALNGNAAMNSIQMKSDVTRFLRHSSYGLWGYTASGATQNNDASFTLEPQ